jgi:pimeloyl-ACP methyl ester carboxylesterase
MNTLRLSFVILILLSGMSVVVSPIAAQDGGGYTCHQESENDIVAAAQALFEEGELSEALELSTQAETLCAAHTVRYLTAAKLTQEIELAIKEQENRALVEDIWPGRVDLGDYEIFMRCIGEGSPTILFENALGTSTDLTWNDIQPAFADVTRSCAYDRAGIGRSGVLPAGSRRTTQDQVDDLRAILKQSDIEGPYVLVGHSIAGFNVLLFADEYPEDVVGMVLVDASHPDQLERFSEIDFDEVPEMGELISPERFDMWASSEQVQAVGSLGDLPLAVVSAGLPPSQAMGEIWSELQADHAARSTNSRHIVAERSGHFVMNTEPELIIEAIEWVLDEVAANDESG